MRIKRIRICASLALLAVGFWPQFNESSAGAQQPDTRLHADPLSLSAFEWARAAAENEVKIVRYNSPYLRYRIHKVDGKGDQTRDVIQSKDGAVARLIASSDKPLTREQDAAERSRLQAMIDSPHEFARHIKEEVSGKKTAVDLLGMMPQAMIYNFAPGQPQRAEAVARPNAMKEIVLDFKPNPAWRAPTLASDALTGLDGRVWIDPETRVVMRMEGRVVQPMNFGWGMLAHIYPGGTVTVEQVALPAHRFMISHFVENVTVRAMMVKTIKVHADIHVSAFTPISELTYQQAIQILLATPVPTAD